MFKIDVEKLKSATKDELEKAILIIINHVNDLNMAINKSDEHIRQLRADGKISMREMILMLKPVMWINQADTNFEEIKPEINIDKWAFENLTRKLNEANARIVEFEQIKAGHLQIQKQMQEEIETLKGDLLEALNKAD